MPNSSATFRADLPLSSQCSTTERLNSSVYGLLVCIVSFLSNQLQRVHYFGGSPVWCPPFRVSPSARVLPMCQGERVTYASEHSSASFSGPLYRGFLHCTAKPNFSFAAKTASIRLFFVALCLCVLSLCPLLHLTHFTVFTFASPSIHDFHVPNFFPLAASVNKIDATN